MHTRQNCRFHVICDNCRGERPRNRNRLASELGRGRMDTARDLENAIEIIIVMVYVFLMMIFILL